MRVSLAYIYKKMRITIVFEQLFIFIFWVFRELKLCQYNKERPSAIVPRKDRQ